MRTVGVGCSQHRTPAYEISHSDSVVTSVRFHRCAFVIPVI
jgi:hypothetical protein